MARFSNTLSRAVVGAGALALVATTAATLARPARLDPHAAGPADSWLKSKAKHRQRFDFPASAGGIPLVHIMN